MFLEFTGQKYVISGRRKNTNCSDDQYQPFKFFSSKLSICAYAKSSCSEEGQIIFSEGTTKEDRSCGCDYSKGYTYLSTPKHQCFCTPKEEDCSCYIATCPNRASLLSGEFCKLSLTSFVKVCTVVMQTINLIKLRSYITKYWRPIHFFFILLAILLSAMRETSIDYTSSGLRFDLGVFILTN